MKRIAAAVVLGLITACPGTGARVEPAPASPPRGATSSTVTATVGRAAPASRPEPTGTTPTGTTPAAPTATKPPPPADRVAVVFVRADDVLNVRAEPNPSSEKVGQLAADATDIETVGEAIVVGKQRWQSVRVPTRSGSAPGQVGWVNARYLTPWPRAAAATAARTFEAFADALRRRAPVSPILSRGALFQTEDEHSGWHSAADLDGMWDVPTIVDGECDGLTLRDNIGEALVERYYASNTSVFVEPAMDARLTNLRCLAVTTGLHWPIWLCFEGPDAKLVAMAMQTKKRFAAKPSIQVRPEVTPVPTWPAQGGTGLANVVLVYRNDVLNMRAEPRSGARIVARLPPNTTGLRLREGRRGGWRQVEYGGKVGWVASRFITEHVSPEAFAADPRPRALIAQLGTRVRARAPLAPLVGDRGLVLGWHGAMVRTVTRTDLDRLARSDEHVHWADAELDFPRDPMTFRDAYLGPFLDAYFDPGLTVRVNEFRHRGHGGPETPQHFAGFRFLVAEDPGDFPCVGMDWWIAAVYFEYVDGVPRIAVLEHLNWEP